MVKERLKRHGSSFKYAFLGIYFVAKSQPNFYIHLAATLLVLLAGIYFGLSTGEWLVVVLTVFMVVVTEALNTAVEIVTDALKAHKKTEADDFYIGAAKDVAAGAVLLASLGAVVVGVIIFLPKIF